jgi:shikimate 5-dehydrogenase
MGRRDLTYNQARPTSGGNNMKYTYAVLGAGRQGTASAYDMARWGDAKRVILADRDLAIAERSAQRVNQLMGAVVAEAVQVEVTDKAALERVLTGVDAFVSAVPYYYNLDITNVAIEVKASMCDLGGNTDIVRQQHALAAQARQAGISIIRLWTGTRHGYITDSLYHEAPGRSNRCVYVGWGYPGKSSVSVQLPAYVPCCGVDQ